MRQLSAVIDDDLACPGQRGAAGDRSVVPEQAVPPPVGRPAQPEAWTAAEPYVKTGITLAAGLLLALAFAGGRVWSPRFFLPASLTGKLFWLSTAVYGAVMLGAMIWRITLWLRYRPMPPAGDAELPSVSVIVPAFNEGPLVRQAILSIAASRYPLDRLEIIAVDDGSADDTWLHILAAAREARGRARVTTLRQPRNAGKRQALYLGFTRARGDVIVTVDSDSILEPDALRSLVTPLVREPGVGCVAGCVQVLNPRQSLITRFLKCYFSISFKFVRAYQNEFRGVFCTPGALSAYRADVLHRVADKWLHQRFLDKPCITGEDRALTNLFLREGRLTAYQGNAGVWSKMPHTYVGMTRMFLRWARSNVRETVFLFRFLFTRFRERHLHAFRVNMLLVLPSLVLPPLLVANNIALMAMNDGYILHRAAVILVFASILAAIYYRNERDSDWVWLLAYKCFWVACLSWVLPYAALTLRNTGWLTRQRQETPDRSVTIRGEATPRAVRVAPRTLNPHEPLALARG